MPSRPEHLKISPELQQWNLQRWKLNHNQNSFRVLVVESDPALSKLISTFLGSEGYSVETADSGVAGWDMIIKNHPHVVISDWTLPDLSGMVLCQRVKANPSHPELRTAHFILLTEDADTNERALGLEVGADELLSKPIDLSELRARVRSGLRLCLVTRLLIQAEQKLAVRQQVLSSLNLTDSLTGLFNQLAMYEGLPSLVEQVHASFNTNTPRSLSMLRITIDQFKEIDEKYQHTISDELIKAIAGRLQSNSDGTSLLYRYAQSEFMCVTPDLDLLLTLKLSKQIAESVSLHPVAISGGLLLDITLSIGGAITNIQNPVNTATLLQQSLQALRQAWDANGNVIRIFEPET